MSCEVNPQKSRVTVALLSDSQQFLGFSLGDVINMNSARRSGAFEIAIFDENGKLVDSTSGAGSSTYRITTEPDVLQSVVLTNSNKTVGGYGRLTVTLITRHGIGGNDDV
jgi:hypothetical protein